eukprot:TRINITY_DN31120_c0_g2_i1.p1 TRINITY_DN31120_c0_g2~~TRINITY_DN31120_c0_g2_i1.p1  ORF type:complete len:388 (-),score=87.55 TRINITY_DN31120_c0_g2_i1:564-1727(-)
MFPLIKPQHVSISLDALVADADDDRWLRLEEGRGSFWSCERCAYLSPKAAARRGSSTRQCEACGAATRRRSLAGLDEEKPASSARHTFREEDALAHVIYLEQEDAAPRTALDSLRTAKTGTGQGEVAKTNASAASPGSCSSTAVGSDSGQSDTGDSEDDDDDDESDDSDSEPEAEELVPQEAEALLTRLPVGGLIEVLCDDDNWYAARVLGEEAEDSKTIRYKVLFEGQRAVDYVILPKESDIIRIVDDKEPQIGSHAASQCSSERCSANCTAQAAAGSAQPPTRQTSDEADADLSEDEGSDDEESGGEEEEVAASAMEPEIVDGVRVRAPPIGTEIEVLCEDDLWRKATMIRCRGSWGRARFDVGSTTKLEFPDDDVVVRLAVRAA